MKTVVVYESHWGNTAAVARAIADGIGDGAVALTTDEATEAVLEGVDLIVAGAPVMMFRLPSDSTVAKIKPSAGEAEPDLTHSAMKTWLDLLPRGSGRSAAFETRLGWSLGGATGAIEKGLAAAGYRPVAKARKFVVTGKTGPLRAGELDDARTWGAELRRALAAELVPAL
jgi:hypothetical protein